MKSRGLGSLRTGKLAAGAPRERHGSGDELSLVADAEVRLETLENNAPLELRTKAASQAK